MNPKEILVVCDEFKITKPMVYKYIKMRKEEIRQMEKSRKSFHQQKSKCLCQYHTSYPKDVQVIKRDEIPR